MIILKKILIIIFYLLLISLIVLVQVSLINNLPAWFKDLNLILILLIFTLFFYDFRSAAVVALLAGLWLEVFSFNFFGLYLLALFFTLSLSDWALRSRLTNRSLYSFLILILLATVIYNFSIALMSYWWSNPSGVLFLEQKHFWLVLIKQSIWSELAAVFLFGLATSLTHRFQPFFLEKK